MVISGQVKVRVVTISGQVKVSVVTISGQVKVRVVTISGQVKSLPVEMNEVIYFHVVGIIFNNRYHVIRA